MSEQEGAPPPDGGAPDAPLPEVDEVRTWIDRIGQRHQGRVTGVAAGMVTFVTAHGATATVQASRVEPAGPTASDVELAAERLAAVGHAQRWLDTTLSTRLEDCVTGAWDALTALHPDEASDDLKVEAAKAVEERAGDLRRRLEEHVAAKRQEQPQ